MRSSDIKHRETWLYEWAVRQKGLLFTEDLVAAGLDRHAIARRVAHHRLTRVHRDVYAFGHDVLGDEARRLGAIRACGADVALSHFAAAAVHRRPVACPLDLVHVSTTRAIQSRDDIAVHRTRHLDRRDVLWIDGLPVTRVPRTLVDLADVLDWRAFRALADAQRRLDLDALRAAQARCPKRVGAPRVTRLLEAEDAHTRSEFERRFLRFVRAHGLPRPDALNVEVAGHQADCVYHFAGRPSRGLVVELDGRAYHQRRAEMRADRHRDTDYQLSGHLILRLVWDDLHPDEAAGTVDRLRRLLGA